MSLSDSFSSSSNVYFRFGRKWSGSFPFPRLWNLQVVYSLENLTLPHIILTGSQMEKKRLFSENLQFEQSRIHSSQCPSRTISSGFSPESWAGLLKAMQRTRLGSSETSYTNSQGARAMSQLTFVPSPATWHTWSHCSAGEVWHNLWMPQWDLTLSPLSRFLRLTVSDTKMEFQPQNLKYVCFSNELISTLNMLAFLIHTLISFLSQLFISLHSPAQPCNLFYCLCNWHR